MKAVHKLDRDEWSEYPSESEHIRCDPNELLNDPECSIYWSGVNCKRCLRRQEPKRES